MEQSEIKKINENLSKLLELTRVTPLFLSKLSSKGVISRPDIEDIDAKPTDLGKSYSLYQIIMTRTNGYNLLLEALRETSQSGVVSILLEARPNVGESPSNAREQRGASSRSDLVIGEENCPLNTVVLAMRRTSTFSLLDTKWEDIALKLDTPLLTQNDLARRRSREHITLITVLQEILSEWRSRKDKEATLQELIKTLEEIGMSAIAQSLKDEFHI